MLLEISLFLQITLRIYGTMEKVNVHATKGKSVTVLFIFVAVFPLLARDVKINILHKTHILQITLRFCGTMKTSKWYQKRKPRYY